MPWPAAIQLKTGTVPIDAHFSIEASGPGASDPRVQFAVASLYARVARQTGLPILSELASSSNPTVTITVAAPDHAPPQRLGDNEKYTLTAGDGHINLGAEQPLGVLRGMETLLQLIQENVAGKNDTGFSVPSLVINDQPRFPGAVYRWMSHATSSRWTASNAPSTAWPPSS